MDDLLYQSISDDNIYNIIISIKNGANVNAINTHFDEGKTPLMSACELDDTTAMEILIESGAKLNLRTHEHGDTALLWCVKWGTTTCFQKLVDILKIRQSFDIDIQNNHGETPLMLACYIQNYEMIEIILSYNPDINICNFDGLDLFESLNYLNKEKNYDETIHFLTTKLANLSLKYISQKSLNKKL